MILLWVSASDMYCIVLLIYIIHGVADADIHLRILMKALKDVVCDWRELGTHLGLSPFRLNEIMIDKREQKNCMMEMLLDWLKGEDCSKQTLRGALENLKCYIFD